MSCANDFEKVQRKLCIAAVVDKSRKPQCVTRQCRNRIWNWDSRLCRVHYVALARNGSIARYRPTTSEANVEPDVVSIYIAAMESPTLEDLKGNLEGYMSNIAGRVSNNLEDVQSLIAEKAREVGNIVAFDLVDEDKISKRRHAAILEAIQQSELKFRSNVQRARESAQGAKHTAQRLDIGAALLELARQVQAVAEKNGGEQNQNRLDEKHGPTFSLPPRPPPLPKEPRREPETQPQESSQRPPPPVPVPVPAVMPTAPMNRDADELAREIRRLRTDIENMQTQLSRAERERKDTSVMDRMRELERERKQNSAAVNEQMQNRIEELEAERRDRIAQLRRDRAQLEREQRAALDNRVRQLESMQSGRDSKREEKMQGEILRLRSEKQMQDDLNRMMRANEAKLRSRLQSEDDLKREAKDARDRSTQRESELKTRIQSLQNDLQRAREARSRALTEYQATHSNTNDQFNQCDTERKTAQDDAKRSRNALQTVSAQVQNIRGEKQFLEGEVKRLQEELDTQVTNAKDLYVSAFQGFLKDMTAIADGNGSLDAKNVARNLSSEPDLQRTANSAISAVQSLRRQFQELKRSNASNERLEVELKKQRARELLAKRERLRQQVQILKSLQQDVKQVPAPEPAPAPEASPEPIIPPPPSQLPTIQEAEENESDDEAAYESPIEEEDEPQEPQEPSPLESAITTAFYKNSGFRFPQNKDDRAPIEFSVVMRNQVDAIMRQFDDPNTLPNLLKLDEKRTKSARSEGISVFFVYGRLYNTDSRPPKPWFSHVFKDVLGRDNNDGYTFLGRKDTKSGNTTMMDKLWQTLYPSCGNSQPSTRRARATFAAMNMLWRIESSTTAMDNGMKFYKTKRWRNGISALQRYSEEKDVDLTDGAGGQPCRESIREIFSEIKAANCDEKHVNPPPTTDELNAMDKKVKTLFGNKQLTLREGDAVLNQKEENQKKSSLDAIQGVIGAFNIDPRTIDWRAGKDNTWPSLCRSTSFVPLCRRENNRNNVLAILLLYASADLVFRTSFNRAFADIKDEKTIYDNRGMIDPIAVYNLLYPCRFNQDASEVNQDNAGSLAKIANYIFAAMNLLWRIETTTNILAGNLDGLQFEGTDKWTNGLSYLVALEKMGIALPVAGDVPPGNTACWINR